MKAVLDKNVLISALIRRGKPRHLLNALFKQDASLITSEQIVEEFSRVSADEKIRKYADDADVADFLGAFLSNAVFVPLNRRSGSSTTLTTTYWLWPRMEALI